MSDLDQDHQRSRSRQAWTLFSVVLFCVVELVLGGWLGPIMAGRFVSPMLTMKLMMFINLGSYYLGGILVGVVSPRVRMLEPAVGALISVAVVLLMGFFVPMSFTQFSLTKLVVGGGIAFALALAGAYTGEKWMGNVGDDAATVRGRIRARMWGDADHRGMLGSRTGAERIPTSRSRAG